MRYIMLTLTIILFAIFGCSSNGVYGTDIPGFTENDDLPGVLVTYEYDRNILFGEKERFKRIDRYPHEYHQCRIENLGDFDNADIIHFNELYINIQVSGDGSILAYSQFEDRKNDTNKGLSGFNREYYVYYTKKTEGGWVEGVIEPVEHSLHAECRFVIDDFALGQDGEVGLISNYKELSYRKNDLGQYIEPETVFYEIDFDKGVYYELPNQPRKSAFRIRMITGNENILAIVDRDSMDDYPNTSVPDYYCSTEYEEIVEKPADYSPPGELSETNGFEDVVIASHWEYNMESEDIPQRTIIGPILNDDGDLLILSQDNGRLVYKSYQYPTNKEEVIFSTDLGFYSLCATHDGKVVVGILKAEPGKYIIYQIDTNKEEYRKYTIDKPLSDKEMRRVSLLGAHPYR